jgi:hypothetical protein
MSVAGWVMLGSAVTSAACCLMPGARATPRAHANAIAMAAVMVLAATLPSPYTHQWGALILFILAAGMVVGLVEASVHRRVEHGGAVEVHRATGSALTAAALLLHQHTGGHSSHQHVDRAVTTHAAILVLQTATIVYLAWTLSAVIRSHPSMTALVRSEHLSMATSLLVMVFAADHIA